MPGTPDHRDAFLTDEQTDDALRLARRKRCAATRYLVQYRTCVQQASNRESILRPQKSC